METRLVMAALVHSLQRRASESEQWFASEWIKQHSLSQSHLNVDTPQADVSLCKGSSDLQGTHLAHSTLSIHIKISSDTYKLLVVNCHISNFTPPQWDVVMQLNRLPAMHLHVHVHTVTQMQHKIKAKTLQNSSLMPRLEPPSNSTLHAKNGENLVKVIMWVT